MSSGGIASQTVVRPRYVAGREVTLLDLLDRLLQGGIVVQGDITLAAADIDLVNLSLQLVVGAVDALSRDLQGQTDTGDG